MGEAARAKLSDAGRKNHGQSKKRELSAHVVSRRYRPPEILLFE